MENKIVRIALTGGPCAGKSSVFEWLERHAQLAGLPVLLVPEAATILVGRGFIIGQDVKDFQTHVLEMQLELEQRAVARAEALGRPCVIVCDRGTLDGAGYCSTEVFDSIALSFGEVRSSLAERYDLVVHLSSVAVDEPEAYTTDNNEARHESLDEAREQERRTLAAWSGHPNRIIIGSSDTFEDKLARAISAMESFVKKALIDRIAGER